jgi:hypothetical protein
MRLGRRLLAQPIGVALDPRCVVALQKDHALRLQVTQGPDNTQAPPIEVRRGGAGVRRVVLRVQQPASFAFIELGFGRSANADDGVPRHGLVPWPSGQGFVARGIEEVLHAMRVLTGRYAANAGRRGLTAIGAPTSCDTTSRTFDCIVATAFLSPDRCFNRPC